MSTFKTKNGVFVTYGALAIADLAVAFNVENFLFKINKLKSESWQAEAASLIDNSLHTVLAQRDQDERYPARMLNAGGVLTLISNDETNPQPLGMILLSEKGGLQLGFGKVELKDLDARLADLQVKLDADLKNILRVLLFSSNDKDEFIAKIKSDEVKLQFASLEQLLIDHNEQIDEAISDLSLYENLQEQASSFDRPKLNKYAVKAIKSAASREIAEEIDLQMNGEALNADRLIVRDALNRETATNYVRSVLAVEDASKFSAKEFNNDFESTTFVVTCAVTQAEFDSLICKQSCQLVQPGAVEIKIVNAEKGMLQTTIPGYPLISGGGNQFTVALYCQAVFNLTAKFVSAETNALSANLSTMYSTDKAPVKQDQITLSNPTFKL